MRLKSFQELVESRLSKDEIAKIEQEATEELRGLLNHTNKEHRLTLRLPLWLFFKIDNARKQSQFRKSLNLFILEILEESLKDK